MAAFEESKKVEKRGMDIFLKPMIEIHRKRKHILCLHSRDDNSYEPFDEKNPDKTWEESGKLAESGLSRSMLSMQKSNGDISVLKMDKSGAFKNLVTADFKFEESSSENFFMETHSNYVYPEGTPGWYATLNCDELWYCFLDTLTMAVMRFQALRNWGNELVRSPRNYYSKISRIATFTEAYQSKQNQHNTTRGFLLPINRIPKSILYETFRLDPDTNSLLSIPKEEYLEIVSGGAAVAKKKRSKIRAASFARKRATNQNLAALALAS